MRIGHGYDVHRLTVRGRPSCSSRPICMGIRCGTVKMLILQHSIEGAANQDAEPGGHLDSFLGVGDQNFVGHIGPLLSKGYLKFFLFSLFSASAAGCERHCTMLLY